ncbi:MAG: ABC transporter ATP-binding protein [Promethearchaeati archaeon]
MTLTDIKSEKNEIAFEVNNLQKYFDDVKAVDGISFKVKRGECFGFLGPNGAGKTTTINVLACYMKPTNGEAKVAGYDVVQETESVKKHIGMCPQENIFYEELNVYENLMFFGKMYEVDKSVLSQRANNLIQKVGLEDKIKTRSEKLSGGMKRRLNLIISLVHDPDILFLDEPTAGLDPQSRRLIWDYIFELKERNKSIFLTTHYMEEADILSDRLAIIDHGKIIAEGTPEHLKDTIGKGDVLTFKIDGPTQKIKQTIDNIRNFEYVLDANYSEDDLSVRITAMDGIGRIGNFVKQFNKNSLQIVDVGVLGNSLENVFLSLTGRSLRE